MLIDVKMINFKDMICYNVCVITIKRRAKMKGSQKSNYIIRWFRKYPIYHRLLYAMIGLIIGPIFIMSLLVFSLMNQTLSKHQVEQMKVINTLLAEDIDGFMADIENFSRQLLFSPVIREGIQGQTLSSEEDHILFTQNIEHLIAQNYSLLNLSSDLLILNAAGKTVYSQGFRYLSDETLQQQIKVLEESQQSTHIEPVYYKGEPYLGMTLQIKSQGSPTPEGYLYVAISPAKLKAILEKGMLNGIESMTLLNQKGEFIVSTQKQLFEPLSDVIKEATKKGEVVHDVVVDSSIITCHVVSTQQWYLCSVTPMGYLHTENQALLVLLLNGLIVLLVLVSFVCYYLWKSVASPLSELTHYMKGNKRLEHQDVFVIEGRDEISYLAHEFNGLMMSLQQLVKEIKLKAEKERQLEMKMLQAQINPHFLFNTLNSIRWMAEMSNVKTISETVTSLSHLLRATLVDTFETVKISEEIELLTDYVNIQKVRYGDCFTFKYQIQDGCEEVPIIKFILQPIVENSLLHGLDEVEQLMISVSVYQQEQHTIINVQDNGTGFNVEEVLAKRRAEKREGKLSSIGLVNVLDRLEIYYQQTAKVSIKSDEQRGTLFSLKLPINGG